jgi:hypothetical protein
VSVEELIELLKGMPPLAYVAICDPTGHNQDLEHAHRNDPSVLSVERGRDGVVVLEVA